MADGELSFLQMFRVRVGTWFETKDQASHNEVSAKASRNSSSLWTYIHERMKFTNMLTDQDWLEGDDPTYFSQGIWDTITMLRTDKAPFSAMSCSQRRSFRIFSQKNNLCIGSGLSHQNKSKQTFLILSMCIPTVFLIGRGIKRPNWTKTVVTGPSTFNSVRILAQKQAELQKSIEQQEFLKQMNSYFFILHFLKHWIDWWLIHQMLGPEALTLLWTIKSHADFWAGS